MNEIFLFLTQFLIAYLLLGCLLAVVISLSLRFCSLNAAARHKIWLTALVVLVFAPIFSLLPAAAIDKSSSTFASSVAQTFLLQIEPSSVPDFSRLAPNSMSVGGPSGSVAILNAGPTRLEALSQAFVKFPLLSELAISLFLLLVLGMAAKLFLYVRSLCALRVMIDSAEAVEGKWVDALEHSFRIMQMRRRTELRHSSKVSTPSTCGVLTPCIILPSAMVRDGCFAESHAQVLQHELAHIKRHDPLIAGIQAVVSIFLFWHPAVNYVNKKIRYEREIACDDWVVSNSEQHGNAAVKAYAYSIVDIAESLSRHTTPAHSVACVNNSSGLQERIRILLDRQVDHSTSVDLMPNVWVASVALGFMFFSSTLLPKLPASILQKEKEIEVAGPPALPASPFITSWGAEVVPLVIEPITFTIQPGERQIVEYDAPLPIPEFITNLEGGESSVILSRAESIESSFGSKSAEITRSDSLAIETIKPVLDRVAPILLDELVDRQAAFTNAAIASDKIDSEENELVFIDSLSKAELADEILKIEIELYRVFNAVTDRDDLKMHCDTQIILGSYISKTNCEPKFLRTARSENIGYSAIYFNTSIGLRKDMQAEYAELAAEILKEMKSNQYMLELYQVLTGLKGRLAEVA